MKVGFMQVFHHIPNSVSMLIYFVFSSWIINEFEMCQAIHGPIWVLIDLSILCVFHPLNQLPSHTIIPLWFVINEKTSRFCINTHVQATTTERNLIKNILYFLFHLFIKKQIWKHKIANFKGLNLRISHSSDVGAFKYTCTA